MDLKIKEFIAFYRRQRKRSDGSKGSGDKNGIKSESNTLIELLPPASPRDHHSDQESVTTVEPQSEPEDFDDQHSESILSSVGGHDLEETGADAKSIPAAEVTTPAEETDDEEEDLPKSTVYA